VSLKALIFDADRSILVAQTKDGFWELPGGGWEHGETMQNCLRREVMEELGASVKEIDFNTIPLQL
jgi:8-oxo-dGTP diphosphatase